MASTLIKLIRKRTSKPKTRTGCRTCKYRRIKCDEGRPACNNCTSTGRSCEGYELIVYLSNGGRRIPAQSALTPPLSAGAPYILDFASQRAFAFFAADASTCTFEGDATRALVNTMLQMSHVEPAMLDAVVAVGALQYARGAALWNGYLSDQDPAMYELALRHYSAAVARIRYMIENDTRNELATITLVLLTCLLFIRFEMLDDGDELVVDHVHKGLNILHDYKKLTGGTDKNLVLKMHPETTLEHLAEVFSQLDFDCVMLGESAPHCSVSAEPRVGLKLDDAFSTFNSLAEARFYLDVLANAVSRARGELIFLAKQEMEGEMDVSVMDPDWYHTLALARSRIVDITSRTAISFSLDRLHDQLNVWFAAFTSLRLATSKSRLHENLLLRMRVFQVWLQVISWRDPTDVSVDQYAQYFEATVDDAEDLLQLIADERHTSGIASQGLFASWPTFQLTSCILLPLYHVAIKCRDNGIRERAVEVLCKSNLQEGVFDNYNLAMYARRIIDIETIDCKAMLYTRIVEATMCVELEDEERMGRIVFTSLNEACNTGFELGEDQFDILEMAVRLQGKYAL